MCSPWCATGSFAKEGSTVGRSQGASAGNAEMIRGCIDLLWVSRIDREYGGRAIEVNKNLTYTGWANASLLRYDYFQFNSVIVSKK